MLPRIIQKMLEETNLMNQVCPVAHPRTEETVYLALRRPGEDEEQFCWLTQETIYLALRRPGEDEEQFCWLTEETIHPALCRPGEETTLEVPRPRHPLAEV